MGLIHHYWTFVSIPLEEQESLEGHSLLPFHVQHATDVFIRHSLPAGYGFSHFFGCIVIGLCTQIDLPDQLALNPLLESDYDNDLH